MSMEEIDIIELLKRVKEGKAPKEIGINNAKFKFIEEYLDINSMYECIINGTKWIYEDYINFDTKIKILDKPIIEELDYSLEELEETSYNESWLMNCIRANKEKINEIIRVINKENKDE